LVRPALYFVAMELFKAKKETPEWLQPKEIVIPQSWFVGFPKGNARYPFTPAAITFFMGEGMTSGDLGSKDILHSVPKKKWVLTEEQVTGFNTMMRAFHVRNAIAASPEGEADDLEEALDARHPDRAQVEVHEVPKERIAIIADKAIIDTVRLYGLLKDSLSGIKSEQDQHALIKAFMETGSNVFRTDKNLDGYLKDFISLLETMYLSGNLSDPTEHPGILAKRAEIFNCFMNRMQEELPLTPAFAAQKDPKGFVAKILSSNRNSLRTLFLAPRT